MRYYTRTIVIWWLLQMVVNLISHTFSWKFITEGSKIDIVTILLAFQFELMVFVLSSDFKLYFNLQITDSRAFVPLNFIFLSDWLELDLSSVVFAYYEFSFLSSVVKESNNEGVHFMYTETLGGGDYLFAFRMLMVLFRREFSFCDSLYLWEVLFYLCTLLVYK